MREQPTGPVVWVTPVPPDRHGGGGHIRQAHLLLALAARVPVHLVSARPVRDPAVRAAVASLVELPHDATREPERPRWVRRARDLWLATFARRPREVADAAGLRRDAGRLLPPVGPAVVIAEYAGFAELAFRYPEARRIVTLHNVGSVMASQEAAVLPLARQRWLARRQAAKWRHWAQRVLPGFDLVVAVSDEDLRALPVPPSQLAVIPNGVDTASFSPTPLPAGPRLVFTGALYTGPNRDGLQWFCREVLPLIRRQQPNATLTIAGMAPTADVAALGAVEGVNVLSDVADIRPLIQEARVVVVPLRVGSGSRLKILEALAAGRPVVSTTVGAEGLDLEPGRHLLLADEPAAFAEAVCRLIGDEASARSLVGPGRRAVEELYAWPDIGERFVDAVLRSGGARSTRSR